MVHVNNNRSGWSVDSTCHETNHSNFSEMTLSNNTHANPNCITAIKTSGKSVSNIVVRDFKAQVGEFF